MPQVVPDVSQVNLTIHHTRACRVPQPMGRRLAQTFCCALVRLARRLQVPDRIVEHLFDDEVHSATCHHPGCATDRQQQRRCFTAIGEGSQTLVLAIAGQLRHQFCRRRQQALLVTLASDRQPPSVLAFAIAPSKKAAHQITHDF
jgi:hypothetical protein